MCLHCQINRPAGLLRVPCTACSRLASKALKGVDTQAQFVSKQPAGDGQHLVAMLAAGGLLVAWTQGGASAERLTCDSGGCAPQALG